MLKEKETVFKTLLNKKQKEFEHLKAFQEDQLESINNSQQLESHDIIENPNENQMREIRVESETLDELQKQIVFLEGFTYSIFTRLSQIS